MLISMIPPARYVLYKKPPSVEETGLFNPRLKPLASSKPLSDSRPSRSIIFNRQQLRTHLEEITEYRLRSKDGQKKRETGGVPPRHLVGQPVLYRRPNTCKAERTVGDVRRWAMQKMKWQNKNRGWCGV